MTSRSRRASRRRSTPARSRASSTSWRRCARARTPAKVENAVREELERLRRRRVAQIQQETAQPVGIALRVLPGLLYGPGHAYGVPFTGSGTIESVGKITRDTIVKFHGDWFKPSNATIVVVGATTMADIRPRVADDYFDTYSTKVGALGLADIARAAKLSVHPESVVWVVVGDQQKIEPGLKELGLGEVRLLDTDGKPKSGK